MNRKKVISIAHKLKAMIEGGTKHEAINARMRLDNLLKKHNLSEAEVFGSVVTRIFEMSQMNEGGRLMERIILSVNPKAKIIFREPSAEEKERKRKSNKEYPPKCILIHVALDAEEYNEVVRKYIFFWKAYNEAREMLMSAFLNKHAKFFIPKPSNEKQEKKEGKDDFVYDTDSDKNKSTTAVAKYGKNIHEKVTIEPPKAHGEEKMPPLNMEEQQRVMRMMSALKNLNYLITKSDMEDTSSMMEDES